MIKAACFALLVVVVAPQAHAQNPQPVDSKPKTAQQPQAKNPEVDEGDVLRFNTAMVAVPVRVMDRNGKYIVDLRREDFEVYEDGTQQEIASFDSTQKPFTIALLLDISDSMRFRIADIQAGALAFVDQLRKEDQVIVIAFDSQIRILSEATTNHDKARAAIRGTSMGGGTRVYDAVNFVVNERLKEIPGRKALILFTDGIDTGSFQSGFKDNERDAEESDVLIYPIQYSSQKNVNDELRSGMGSPNGSIMLSKGNAAGDLQIARAQSYLRALSTKTGARLYRVDDAEDLTKAFVRIAGELRQTYTLSYYPKTQGPQGQRRLIKVRVTTPGVSVRARDSYVFGTRGPGKKK